MKNKLQLLTGFFFILIQLSYSQIEAPQDTVFLVDTLIVFDTVKIAKKVVVENEKIEEKDSLPTPIKEDYVTLITDSSGNKNDRDKIPKAIVMSVADYMYISVGYSYDINNFYGAVSFGYNFHKQYPLILGLGGGYYIPITNKIYFRPAIYSYLYLPLSFNFGTTNYNHLCIGFKYIYSDDIAFQLTPSIYFSPKSYIHSQEQYNNIIDYVSPIAPLYSEKTSSNEYYDIGFGISLGIEFMFE